MFEFLWVNEQMLDVIKRTQKLIVIGRWTWMRPHRTKPSVDLWSLSQVGGSTNGLSLVDKLDQTPTEGRRGNMN